jgi:hypothetical protein
VSDWQFYMCAVEEHPAMILVDVDLRAGAPDRARPYLLQVRIPHLEGREDGLPSPEERPRIDEIEDLLEEIVERHDGVNVGHAHFAARTSVYFYVASSEIADTIADEIEAAVDDRELDISGGDDPEWEQYLEFLYPNRLGWQWIRDRDTLSHLEAQGDPGEVARQIDFEAQLPTRQAAETFMVRVAERGFRIDEAEESAESELPWRVRFSMEMAPRDVFPMSGRLSTDLEELGGLCDGWSCEAVVRH